MIETFECLNGERKGSFKIVIFFFGKGFGLTQACPIVCLPMKHIVNFQYSTITMGDKHRRIFYRDDFPDSVRESWSYALRNKIFFSFPQFISTAAMTHTIYMGFLCISLVLVILCEASAKKGIREETQKEKKVHLKDIFSGRMKRYENTVEPSFKNNQESKYR